MFPLKAYMMRSSADFGLQKIVSFLTTNRITMEIQIIFSIWYSDSNWTIFGVK